ncbi:MAG: hypothetical protein DI570_27750, partial [Phenylobacterium zucineum]
MAVGVALIVGVSVGVGVALTVGVEDPDAVTGPAGGVVAQAARPEPSITTSRAVRTGRGMGGSLGESVRPVSQ